MINTTRAYATGESFYSKAANAAVLSLYRFADTGQELYWDAFRSSLEVNFGDRATREELERTDPDLEVAAAGYRRGGNSIDDIPDAIRVFRLFRRWGPFKAAVEDWRRGDETIDQLLAVGIELHSLSHGAALTESTRERVIGEIDSLNIRLTNLENSFSEHIAAAARAATRLVTQVLGVVSLLLWSFGVGLAWRTYRRGITAEIHLKESEERFRNFAELASDWFWETGPDLKITYISERFAKSTGLSPQDLLGRPGQEVGLLGAASNAEQQHVTTVEARETFRGYMHRHVHINNTEQFWKVGGLPVYDADGAFIGYRGTGSNVSQEVRAAHALREAKELSDIANRAKSEFLANMSHELRTPLNAILGFSEVIRDRFFGHSSEKYIEYARDIFTSGSLLLALIDDVLDIAKIEAGRMELYEEAVDVAEVIETSTQLMRQKLDAANLRLTTDVAPSLPPIRADERKMQQIMLNLLSNSIKFTPAGGSISIAALCDESGNLKMSVSDTGIGIAPDKIAKALEPFGQIESALTRAHAGTGLGLSLVKALTELHDGSFAITSEVACGTNAVVTLPRERFLDGSLIYSEETTAKLVLSSD